MLQTLAHRFRCFCNCAGCTFGPGIATACNAATDPHRKPYGGPAMFITITIDTDHPEAWENIRADLESLVEDRDENGIAYAYANANAVRMTEAVYEGMAPRRTFTAECDPAELDA